MFAKLRHGNKAALAADMRDVFRTGQRDYTVEEAWNKWQEMCEKWGKDYRSIKLLRNNADYKAYLTYLNYAPEIQSMIYTTNWIERLNRDFRRVTRMRTAMPNEDSVITLMGSVAIDHKAFDRKLLGITCDKQLFPDRRLGFLSGMAHLDTVEPPMGRTAQLYLCFQFGRSLVAGGLLLSRARFLVRLRCEITKKRQIMIQCQIYN